MAGFSGLCKMALREHIHNPTAEDLKSAKARERRAMRTGKWGEWRRTDLPNGASGNGWNREIRYAWANDLYAVLCRPVQIKEGKAIHCAIRTISQLEPPWRHKQRIKNELFGPDRVAVEVMPTTRRLVDEADMYHIWIMPEGYKMPFCLCVDNDDA
jgi:hypothetical protein